MEIEKVVLIVLLVAITSCGWLVNNWIRAKHGYSLEDEWGGKTERPDTAEAEKLRSENSEMRKLIGKMDQRVQVLERIVTDRGYDIATQIEALRDTTEMQGRDTGVPLEIKNREKA